jgi:quinolinate synthase
VSSAEAAVAAPSRVASDLHHRHEALVAKLRGHVPELELAVHLPWIDAIQSLKREQHALILAHNYQTPEIYHGVADVVGDSLALAQQALTADADTIVMCGVHFMAETAKLLNPARTVLIPDLAAGCSLAASITAADVRALRRRHPGVPVVSYVNTSAEVKAESDVCCTSANAVHVVESLGRERVIFLPDRWLGAYVARQTQVELILWEGACEVHERFTAAEVRAFRRGRDVHVLAHPECPPDVLAEADFVGSTAAMVGHLKQARPPRVVMITECSMSDNVAVEFPEIEFTRPCNLCPHMKRITLPKIHDALSRRRYEVTVDARVAERARLALERMVAIGRREGSGTMAQPPARAGSAAPALAR